METFRERHLATFERKPVSPVVWQPRLEHWYHTHQRLGTLPRRYRGMSLPELYDDLGCSMRGYHLFNPCLCQEQHPELVVTREERADQVRTTWTTPVGALTQVEKRTELSHLVREFPVKSVDDLAVLEWMLRGRRWWWDEERYRQALAEMGERGAPTIYVPRFSLMRCIIEWMGLEGTIYLLADHPREMERLLAVVEETDDPIYEVVAACPVRIINHGDNVHADLLPPPLLRRWGVPRYRRRAERLHRAGKFVFPHWDGYVKTILPLARECDFDGIEAITPEPQGDVTLEEARREMGEMILIDGLPAIYFLPDYPVAALLECTRRCLELFAPHLVLGISDEISPPGDIERVRMVSELVAGGRG